MEKPLSQADLHTITGLGRPLDPGIRSNRVAIAGSAVFAMIALTIAFVGDGEFNMIHAAAVGVAAFLGWALGRELDPDRESTAAIAMTVAGLLSLVAVPGLLVVAVLLLVTRILSRTVGSELGVVDLFVVIGAAAYAGSEPVAWPIAALLVYAVVRRGDRHAIPTAMAMGLAALVSAGLFVEFLDPGTPLIGTWLLLVGLLILGWRRLRVTKIHSRADNGTPIPGSGVALARLATLTSIAAGAVMAPETALADLGPAVAAFAAVAIIPRRTPQPEEVRDERPAVLEAALPPVV